MMRLGFLTSFINLIAFLIASGRSNRGSRIFWKYEGDRETLSPFVRVLSNEDIRLYDDVYSLLKADLINYEEGLEHEDEQERLIDSFDYTSGQDITEQLKSAISEPMEADDNGARQFQTFILSDDDLVVFERRNKKEKERNNLREICKKGNAFGNWLIKLCSKYS